MARCTTCGTLIFGGKKEGSYQFCNDNCYQNGWFIVNTDQISHETIIEHTRTIHEGACPICNEKNGSIDVHTSYKVWSAIIVTQWNNNPQVSCRPCGIKSQTYSAFFSLFFGWWGVPWGVLVTPAQIIKNIMALAIPPNPDIPSKKLERMVRINLGKYIYLEQQRRSNE